MFYSLLFRGDDGDRSCEEFSVSHIFAVLWRSSQFSEDKRRRKKKKEEERRGGLEEEERKKEKRRRRKKKRETPKVKNVERQKWTRRWAREWTLTLPRREVSVRKETWTKTRHACPADCQTKRERERERESFFKAITPLKLYVACFLLLSLTLLLSGIFPHLAFILTVTLLCVCFPFLYASSW